MFKIQVNNPAVYKALLKFPLLKTFVLYDLRFLERIGDEDVFIAAIDHLRLNNGTYKTTRKNRFSELNDALVSLLGNKDKKILIHDFAVSDGITSCELYEILNANGCSIELHASDLFSKIVSFRLHAIKKYNDNNGSFIYGSLFNIIGDKKLSNKFLLSKILGLYLERYSFSKHKKTSLLLNPLTTKLIETGKIKFQEMDIFNISGIECRYDIIRCMNVLNRQYFSDNQLVSALKGILSVIKNGGLLIVGRTDIKTGKNYTSIFQYENTDLKELQKFNGGSEISDLVFLASSVIKMASKT